MRREVQTIYYLASLHTRPWYDRAVCQEGVNWDNWIIRWCLWHAFRYRDSRNTNSDAPDGRRTRGSPPEVGNSQRSMPQEETGVLYRVNGEFCFQGQQKTTKQLSDEMSHLNGALTTVGTHGVFWDPVRNP
jgi:hypothetical protein